MKFRLIKHARTVPVWLMFRVLVVSASGYYT
jgi:hypothetical protein